LHTNSVTITNGYDLLDSEAAILAAINSSDPVIGGATAIATNNAGSLTLDVTDAYALVHAGVTITHGYSISDSVENLFTTPTGSTLTADAQAVLGSHIAVTLSDAATVAQIAAIRAYDASGTMTYTLSDYFVNIGLAANSRYVSGHTYSLLDAADSSFGNQTVTQAYLLTAATNYGAEGYTYTLQDSIENLTGGSGLALMTSTQTVVVTDAATIAQINDLTGAGATLGHLTYSLSDSETTLLAAIEADSAVVAGVHAHELATNDASSVALLVEDAVTLRGASVTITHGYTISDSAAAVDAALSGNLSVLEGATAITTNDSNVLTLTVAQADGLHTASVTITHGYDLSDSETAILAAINDSDYVISHAAAIATNDVSSLVLDVTDAEALRGANVTITNHYTISDTAAAVDGALTSHLSVLEGATAITTNGSNALTLTVAQADGLHTASVAITHGYDLLDSETAILAAINGSDPVISGASAIATNNVGSLALDVTDAEALRGALVTITNGYTISDSAAAVDAALSGYLPVLESATAITTNDSNALILTVAQADGLHTASVAITHGYDLLDSETTILAAINGSDPVISGASAIATNNVGSLALDVTDAEALRGHNVTITNHYTISDTAAAVDGALASHLSVLEGATAITTNDSNALTLNVSQAEGLASVTITNGYTISDTAAAVDGALASHLSALEGASSITTSDTDALTLTVAQAYGLLDTHNVTITNGYGLSDSAGDFFTTSTGSTLNASATAVLGAHTAVTVTGATIAQVEAIKTVDTSGTVSYSISDAASDLFVSNTTDFQSGALAVAEGATHLTITNATCAQIAALEAVPNNGLVVGSNFSYTLLDTLANLDSSEYSDVLSHAGSSYSVLFEETGLTVTQANLLVTSQNFNEATQPYTIQDTVVDLVTSGSYQTALGDAQSVTVQLSSPTYADLANYTLDTHVNIVDMNNYNATLTVAESSALTITDMTGTTNSLTLSGSAANAYVHLNTDYDSSALVLGSLDVSGVTGLTTLHLDSNAESSASANQVNGLTLGGATTIDITGSHALNLTVSSDYADTIDAHSFTGALNLTLATSHAAANTIDVSALASVAASLTTTTDVVSHFNASLDTINVTAATGAHAIGAELSASSGLVTSGYATAHGISSESTFVTAVEGVTGATAGDVVAWSDGANTYLAEFTGNTANHAHVVELTGVNATALSTTTYSTSTVHIA
jgi:hypothetical protein